MVFVVKIPHKVGRTMCETGELITVNVYKFPENGLEKLRIHAIANGVGGSNSDIVRWAALQFLRAMEAADPAAGPPD
jgi:hypothetical protein